MASPPFVGPAIRHRQPMTGSRMIIVASAVAFALFLLWASLAQVDEVTAGEGRVIPSSKLQTITAADPATVSELLVRSGQRVHKGELLVRLDNPESASQLGQLQAETEFLAGARIAADGRGHGRKRGMPGRGLRGRGGVCERRANPRFKARSRALRLRPTRPGATPPKPRQPSTACKAPCAWPRTRST